VVQKIGFALVGVGGLVLIGWSVRGFFLADDIPLLIRIAVGAIGVGLLILIGSVIKDRLAAAKTEDFKEVKQ
jgi:urea transporter